MKEFQRTNNTIYYVTDAGEIFAKRISNGRLRQKSPTLNKNRGYWYVRTELGNYAVHRLVAQAFIPNPLGKPTVNHIDGNKNNNDVSNLEWATYKEQSDHAIKTGLSKKMKKNEGANLKWTDEQVRTVYSLVKGGLSYSKAGAKIGMPYSTVAHIMRGSRRLVNE